MSFWELGKALLIAFALAIPLLSEFQIVAPRQLVGSIPIYQSLAAFAPRPKPSVKCCSLALSRSLSCVSCPVIHSFVDCNYIARKA